MRKKNGNFFILFCLVFLDLLGLGIIVPVLPALFVNTHGAVLFPTLQNPELWYGILIALYPLTQFFSAPLLGTCSDRFGRKPVLWVSLLGTCIGYVLFALGIVWGQLWLLFLGRFIDGATGGNISVAMSSIADMSDAKSKAKNFGLIGMAFGMGFILGPTIGGVLSNSALVSWFSLSTPFWAAGILALLNMLLLLRIYKETLVKRVHKKFDLLTGLKDITKAFRLPNARILFLVLFIYTCAFSFFTQFFQLFAIDRFQVGTTFLGLYFGYIGFCIALTQGLIVRIVTKRFSSEKIISFTLLGLAGTLSLLLFPHQVYWLFVISPFIALFSGLSNPNLGAMISNQAGPEAQGEILGIQQSLQALGQGIPPLLAGVLSALNSTFPLILAVAFMLLAWIVFLVDFNLRSHRKLHT